MFSHLMLMHTNFDLETLGPVANAGLRIGLALVTLASGLGKAWDLPGTRQAMTDFGVPYRWLGSATVLLPIGEVALAFGLVLDPTSSISGYLLCLLGLFFCVGIGNLIRQHREPPCHCFGALHSSPVGTATLMRAGVLAALAWGSARLPFQPLTSSLERGILAVALLIASGSLISNYIQWKRSSQNRQPRRLKVGQRLPNVPLVGGGNLQDTLTPKTANLIVLLSTSCGPCRAVKDELAHWSSALAGSLRIIEVYSQSKDAQETLPPSAQQISKQNFDGFLSPTPGAMLVDSAGILQSPPVAGAEQIEALIRVAISGKPLAKDPK